MLTKAESAVLVTAVMALIVLVRRLPDGPALTFCAVALGSLVLAALYHLRAWWNSRHAGL